MTRLCLALILLLSATASWARDIDLRPLAAAQLPTLLEPDAQGVRVIMFWTLGCVYCEPNFAALAAMQKRHAGRVQLLTVATDNIAQRDALTRRLRSMRAEGYPAYAYTSSNPDRMNYLVAAQWGGVTPFTLVIRADGSREGYVGRLTTAQVRGIAAVQEESGG